jgi:hypothetical protein
VQSNLPPVAYASYTYTVNSMIGSALTGQILNWSPRRVQRNARQLGGRFVSGRWIFDESKVLARAAQLAEKRKANQ